MPVHRHTDSQPAWRDNVAMNALQQAQRDLQEQQKSVQQKKNHRLAMKIHAEHQADRAWLAREPFWSRWLMKRRASAIHYFAKGILSDACDRGIIDQDVATALADMVDRRIPPRRTK
jgi:hypothetical protein